MPRFLITSIDHEGDDQTTTSMIEAADARVAFDRHIELLAVPNPDPGAVRTILKDHIIDIRHSRQLNIILPNDDNIWTHVIVQLPH
jgi:hypothetical protein